MLRRSFLKSAAMTSLAAPFLGLLRGTARADSPGVAKRLIIFFSPNGTIHRHWRPSGTGTDFAFPQGSILEPLARHRSDLVVISGLDFIGVSNHEPGMLAMLTGTQIPSTPTDGASVDQYVASLLPEATQFPSLEFGVITSPWGQAVQTRMSYRRWGTFAQPDDDPTSMWRRLFGNVTTGTGMEDPRALKRRSILTLLKSELTELRTQLPTDEKWKLDVHTESLRRVETTLANTGALPAGCTAPMRPDGLIRDENDQFPQLGKAQMDMLVTAMACGMTRVASIQWSHTVSPRVFSWLGQADGHHDLSHSDDANAAGVARFVESERWFADQFAYLLDLLQQPEPGGVGRMIDNSVVVWAKELGDPRLHNCIDVPFVLAGGGNGFMQTGRHLVVTGQPHNKLLVSLCHAMGLTNQTFGDPSLGTGPLPGLAG